MAHREQLKFISLLQQFFLKPKAGVRVLEVGSYDVNGSVRQFFPGADYVGADLTPGPGVDLVKSGHEIDFPDGSFDVTVSCECFEHNADWVETFNNMYRMTRPGGMVVVTCASRGRIEHGTARTEANLSPGTKAVGYNYYRNLTSGDFKRAFRLPRMFSAFRMYYLPTNHDLYFFGWKHGGGGTPDDFAKNLPTFERGVHELKHMQVRDPLPVHHRSMLAVQELFIIGASYVLPDPVFQNARRKYLELTAAPKKLIKKVLGLG